ncbi:MAG: hypothetical protein CMC78_03675 [Flavobacteriaceae bacterium]|nr:hypothetical protein [Flavobacteriaceae bacterium]|tara:strand:+ start:290 stop:493 length:204 start_codon:yes stop_codon:yes gene_type:complete
MGAVKAMIMDMEDKFFCHVSEEDYSCESYQEFESNVLNKPGIQNDLSQLEIKEIASTTWNEYWSNYP